MAVELKFVDAVSATAATRLDINDGVTWRLLEGTEFPPPGLRRSSVASLMNDGATVPASAYENRTIRLELVLETASADAAATALQNLSRQLDRAALYPGEPDNILKWAPHTTAPVFFRTFRSEFTRFEVIASDTPGGDAHVTVTLLAEPFAIGLREDVTPVVVSNDPAAGTNPCRFDITGVKGDVETPLILVFTGTGTSGVGNKQSVIAVRRRPDPTALNHVLQAESMTVIGADTTVSSAGADAAMSGATNDYIRTTFATSAVLSNRANDTFPADGTAIEEARGRYRVFGRYRKSGTGTAGDMTVRLAYGDSTSTLFTNMASVALPAGAGPAYVDLGVVAVPIGHDPREFGYSGVELNAVLNTAVWQAGRNSGALTLDLDFLFFVPADDSLCIVDWPTKDTTYALDGVHDMAFAINTGLTSILTAEAFAGITGGLPYISPGVTNRIYFLRDVTPGQSDAIANTTNISPYYYPRYLNVRPVST